MMMNPAFYKTIHEEATRPTEYLHTRFFSAIKRHGVKLAASCLVFMLLFSSFLLMKTDASTEELVASAEEISIVVVSGDTLWAIAKRYTNDRDDVRKTIYEIKERNRLQSANIHPGQKLIIPN